MLNTKVIDDINNNFPSDDLRNLTKINIQGNNKIYKFSIEETKYIIKYYGFFNDSLERLNRESNFLNYCYKKKIFLVPKLFHIDKKEKFTIMSYICGKTFKSPCSINKELLNQAINFILKLNQDPPISFIRAKDSCNNTEEYLSSVKKKIKILSSKNIVKEESKLYVEIIKKIIEDFKKIRKKFESKKPKFKNINFTLQRKDLCISPSDFGFQNTLINKNIVYFIDFEYAGLDDPVKCLLDFFLNPNHKNLDLKDFYFFLSKMKFFVRDQVMDENRIIILYEILRIKWCCILLNIFDKNYFKRKIFSDKQTDNSKFKEMQLLKILDYIGRKKLFNI